MIHRPSDLVPDPAAAGGGHRASFSRDKVSRVLQALIEGLVLLLVCLAPWAFGGVDRRFEQAACAVIAGLIVLWAIRLWIERRWLWQKCPVAICLALIVLLGAAQLVSWPASLLEWLSPATSELYQELLPDEREVLPPGEVVTSPIKPGSTISLYPSVTRQMLWRGLAILLLFLVVRNNVPPVGGLRRLSIAMLVNATCLSLFGFVQFFTSPRGWLYWTFSSEGTVFGPFVNRNHFAFHVNIAIGLGIGLLLCRGWPAGGAHALEHSATRASRQDERRHAGSWNLLQDPAALWIGVALGLLLAATIACLSRGGFVALLTAAIACGALVRHRGGGGWRLGAGLLVLAVGGVILMWFGYERFAPRLSTLWSGDVLQDDRVKLLLRGWSCVQQFPVFGTGYGTFPYVEPMSIHDAADVGSIYRHAHNEYLEAAIEGGMLRLLLAIVAIGLVYRLSWRAFRSEQTTDRGLVLGGLFAFTTVVIHSFFEFGLHLPAIAMLVAVLAACLSGWGAAGADRPDAAGNGTADPIDEPSRTRPSGLTSAVPLLAVAVAILLGVMLVRAAADAARARDLRRAAFRLRLAAPEAQRQLKALSSAAERHALDAELQTALGDAWLEYDRQILGTPVTRAPSPERLQAMRYFIRARDLCPIAAVPHVRLAANREFLQQGDSPGEYLDRARRVAPADPELWFLCGRWELSTGQPARAWVSWKRSLKLADRYLPEILAAATPHLTAREIVERVLPERPEVLLAAARHAKTAAEPDVAGRSALYLRRAAALLEAQHRRTADDWARLAEIRVLLDESSAAIEAYGQALALDPEQVPWRYALAEQLDQQGRLDEAREQLRIVLAYEPQHARALPLLKDVSRRLTMRGARAEQRHPGAD